MITSEGDIARIRSIDLFASMSNLHFSTLAASASFGHFAPRITLFQEGNRVRTLYTIIDGSVELFSDAYDKRRTFAVINSAKACAPASIFAGRYVLSARTLEPSRLLSIPSRAIHDLIGADGNFARAIMGELASDCELLIDDLKIQKLRSSLDRVVHWIRRSDRAAGGTGTFALPCNRRTLASYLGITPESLSRNFSALAREGVMISGRRVTVRDHAGPRES